MKSLLIFLGVTIFSCGAAPAQTGFAAYVGRPVSDLAQAYRTTYNCSPWSQWVANLPVEHRLGDQRDGC
jgi:hypothetical protein